MMKHFVFSIAITWMMSGAIFALPPAQPPSSYFTVIPGDAPILLTAPHGGTLSYPFPPRSCTGGQTCIGDANTRLLAPKAADDFFALTGLRPYVIIAQGDREFMDLNRSNAGGTPNDSYEDPLAEPYYDFYHDTIQGFIDDITLQFGGGLLLDIHGQSTVPGSILRGTKNGLTTTELLSDFGPNSLNGPNSIFGSLDASGYSVDPDVATPFTNQVENPSFNGGFTVQNYGSHQLSGIDAIQIEFGIDFRTGTAWQQTATDLATAMDQFYSVYLTTNPGDYNVDGTVDAADYTVWRDNEGASAGSLPNDTDGGVIGQAQYDTWVANFGSIASSANSTSIPEPTSLVLLSFAMLVPGRRRRETLRKEGQGTQSQQRPRTNRTKTHGKAISLLLTMMGFLSMASPASAEVLTFTDQPSWEAAVTGVTLEDFEGAAADVLFGLAYQPTDSPNGDLGLQANANFDNNASIDIAPYISSGAGINGNVVVNLRFIDQGNNTNSQETVIVTLPSGISAFAFDYNSYDLAGDGTFLSFAGTNGATVPAFNSTEDGFFGLIDTDAGASIGSFSFTGDPTTGGGTSAFASFDDVRYGIAGAPSAGVPEPTSLALISLMGCTAFCGRRNRASNQAA